MIGHWEQSYLAPLTEAPFWALPLRDFGVCDWWMHPVSGVVNNEQQVRLSERASLEDCMAELADRTFVFVEPPTPAFPVTTDPEWLVDFDHPDEAVYVFGSAHFNSMLQGYDPNRDRHIALETHGNKGVLWPHQVAVTVLHDRLMKQKGFSWQ